MCPGPFLTLQTHLALYFQVPLRANDEPGLQGRGEPQDPVVKRGCQPGARPAVGITLSSREP